MGKTTLQIHVMYQAVICFDNVKVKVFIMLTFGNEYDLKQVIRLVEIHNKKCRSMLDQFSFSFCT